MKVDFDTFGGFSFEAENDRDSLWMERFVVSVEKDFRPILGNFFSIDMESMCVRDHEGTKMVECSFEEVIEKGVRECKVEGHDYVWGNLVGITFNALGSEAGTVVDVAKIITELHEKKGVGSPEYEEAKKHIEKDK